MLKWIGATLGACINVVLLYVTARLVAALTGADLAVVFAAAVAFDGTMQRQVDALRRAGAGKPAPDTEARG